VIADLAVDPYTPDTDPPVVRGVEGIPQGSLDQYVFEPNDANWSATIPADVPTAQRRTVVSCYSWPGIHPAACMRHYAQQLEPLLEPQRLRRIEPRGWLFRTRALPGDATALAGRRADRLRHWLDVGQTDFRAR